MAATVSDLRFAHPDGYQELAADGTAPTVCFFFFTWRTFSPRSTTPPALTATSVDGLAAIRSTITNPRICASAIVSPPSLSMYVSFMKENFPDIQGDRVFVGMTGEDNRNAVYSFTYPEEDKTEVIVRFPLPITTICASHKDFIAAGSKLVIDLLH